MHTRLLQLVTVILIADLASSRWTRSVTAGDQVKILKGHLAGVIAVAFSPDGKTLASASAGDTIKLWDVKSGALLRTLSGESGAVSAIVFSRDSKILASGGGNGDVTLWELASGRACLAPSGYAEKVLSLAFAPHDAWLAAAGSDRLIRLWSPKSGRFQTLLQGHTGGVLCAVFSPDGKTLVSGGADQQVKFWDVVRESEDANSALRQRIRRGPVVSVEFSPDGKELAIATRDVVEAWDIAHSQRQFELAKKPKGAVWLSARYSQQGALIAIGTGAKFARAIRVSAKKGVSAGSPQPEDRVLRLWDAKTGHEIARLAGHHDSVRAVALSPDGTLVASGSRDKTVRLWDLTQSRAPGEEPPVAQVAASSDDAASAPQMEGEIASANPAPIAAVEAKAAQAKCLKGLEILTAGSNLDPSAGLAPQEGGPGETLAPELSTGTGDSSSPLLLDGLSLILDKAVDKVGSLSGNGDSKTQGWDFANRFQSSTTQAKLSTGEAQSPNDRFASKPAGSNANVESTSGWDVFRSPPIQRVGHGSSETSSGGGSPSQEFHYSGGHDGSSGGGGHSHGGGADHQKK